jgi:hypothetical protein
VLPGCALLLAPKLPPLLMLRTSSSVRPALHRGDIRAREYYRRAHGGRKRGGDRHLILCAQGRAGAVIFRDILTYLFSPTTSLPIAHRTALVFEGSGLAGDRFQPSDVGVPLIAYGGDILDHVARLRLRGGFAAFLAIGGAHDFLAFEIDLHIAARRWLRVNMGEVSERCKTEKSPYKQAQNRCNVVHSNISR